MKERITISVSSINGSRHFHLCSKTQLRLRWVAGTCLALTLSVAGGLVYLNHLLNSAQSQQKALVQQSESLNGELASLKRLKAELENEMDERENRLAYVAERLGELEHVLGVGSPEESSLERRLDVAAINSAVRLAMLDSIPNGLPVVNARQSSPFGERVHPVTRKRKMHRGLDFAVKKGTPIYATADGVVETVRSSQKGYGNFIRLQHAFGFTSSYSHLKSFAVRHGDFVTKGDLIAYSGNTGLSSGPHLHYEVRFVGRALNPQPFVQWGMDNFEHIFDQESKVKWAYLVDSVTLRVSRQLQLSSQKDVKFMVSSG